MAYLQQVLQLMNAVNLSGADGNNPYTTPVLDLRGGPQSPYVRVNSLLVRGSSAASQPDFNLEWAGGVTDDQVGTTPNLGVLFQPFTANDDLLNSVGVETLQIVPFPVPYAPFVRFQLTSLSGSPVDSVFSLWALVQVRDDV